LLESNIAPTRLSMRSLDQPLELKLIGGKVQWEDRFWSLLNVFGAYLDNAPLDDPEVESFEEDAVLMLTFHQGKGLEFDHVYVAGIGRAPDYGPALRTKLFSGQVAKYAHGPDGLKTTDKAIQELATADRDREVYVAMTRAKHHLTILHDDKASANYMAPNPGIEPLFAKASAKTYPKQKAVRVREFSAGG
jgi:ATP-dependent exoDNAse (exonuclease V) beta subunit